MRKGIILAGGAGTRLHPVTYAVSKQLLPVYDKPMVYYPLSTLMLAGHPRHSAHFDADRSAGVSAPAGRWQSVGPVVELCGAAQPEGLAQAFIIGRRFIGSDPSALVLGDNLFYGHGLPEQLKKADARAAVPRCSPITSRIRSATG